MTIEFLRENFGEDHLIVYAIFDEIKERCFLWEIENFPYENFAHAIYSILDTGPVRRIKDGVLIECVEYELSDFQEIRRMLIEKGFNLPEIRGE